MIAPLLVAAALAALPEGTVRYRAELGGVPVGLSELRLACAGATCTARWVSRQRLPDEAGGGVSEAGVDVEVDARGRYRRGPLRAWRSGVSLAPDGPDDTVPASLAEVVLLAELARGEERVCVPFFDEERPSRRQACARRDGDAVLADIGSVPVRIVPAPDGFPQELVVRGRFRYVRDPAAQVPLLAPHLAGTRVAGPPDPAAARSFCGVPVDPVADEALAGGLPAPVAKGKSCRDRAEAWLANARALGHEGRTAVGVAWDGTAFVWHAWAEVRSGAVWIPVDPSFGERPARGPRFTLARYAGGDPAARDAAGGRILACWGSATVE